MLQLNWPARPIALVFALSLAACSELALPAMPSFIGGSSGVASLPLLGGGVTAKGPNGYCVDRSSSSAGTGFAVIAPCDVQSDDGNSPSRRALITLQIDASLDGVNLTSIADVLQDEEARERLLGEVDLLTSLTLEQSAGATLVIYRTSGVTNDIFQDLEARVFMPLSGRLSVLTLRGLAVAPLAVDALESLSLDAINALQQANEAGVSDPA